jgi:hypothetical protein
MKRMKPIGVLSMMTALSSSATSTPVISRGDAAGTYQPLPDVCRLENGDLRCVFYAGYGHVSLLRESCPKDGRIHCVRSSEDVRTWSALRILCDGPFDDRDPHIAQTCNVYENPTGYE